MLQYQKPDELDARLRLLENRPPASTKARPLQPSTRQNGSGEQETALRSKPKACHGAGPDTENQVALPWQMVPWARVVVGQHTHGSVEWLCMPSCTNLLLVEAKRINRVFCFFTITHSEPSSVNSHNLHRCAQNEDDVAQADSICARLSRDAAVRTARAEYLCSQGDALAAYKQCCAILQQDPRSVECMSVYLACMVELGKKVELFQLGQRCALTGLASLSSIYVHIDR